MSIRVRDIPQHERPHERLLRREEANPQAVADQPLHHALLVAATDGAEAVAEQEVALQAEEPLGELTVRPTILRTAMEVLS